MGKQTRTEWNKTYRLSLVENQTHRKIRDWKINKAGIILGGATALVVVFLIMFALLALTPLKTIIPGYPDAKSRRDVVENALKIDSLENAITRWEFYAGNLSRVLTGQEEIDRQSVAKGEVAEKLSKEAADRLAVRDSILREKVHEEEQFGVSGDKERDLPITGLHFFTPVKGVISNKFDMVLHPALDITAPAGTIVSSVLDGTVIFAGWDDQSGYTMQIQHKGNIVSTYKHNQKLLRKIGEKVNAGTPVALLGNTGSLTTGDHLHFELWYNGEAIDPTIYINF